MMLTETDCRLVVAQGSESEWEFKSILALGSTFLFEVMKMFFELKVKVCTQHV